MQTQIMPGSPTMIPFEEQVGAEKAAVIAQELETEFPELISVNPDGTKGVKYQNAVAVLFEAGINLLNVYCGLPKKEPFAKNNSRVVALGANAQIGANMNKVFSLLTEDIDLGVAA